MSDLTPEEEAEVTRLLASAAEPVTMPPSVSARLDDVLAGLVAERTESHAPQTLGEVIPIKHRRWPRVLLAAAAVSLFGYLGSGLLNQSGQDDASTSADSGAVMEESAPRPTGPATDEDRVAAPKSALPEAAVQDLAGLVDDTYLLDALNTARGQQGASCPVPTAPNAGAYERYVKQHRLVVVLNRLGGNAARADIYPCGQTVFPVATRLLLDAR